MLVGRRLIHLFFVLTLTAALMGCGWFQSSPTPTPVQPAPTLAPGETLRLSGQGSSVSQPFELSSEQTLRVNWKQSSKGKFVLTLANLDQAMAETQYGRVTFEIAVGPSDGSAEYQFIAGKYTVNVEAADGLWEVWIESVAAP